MASCFEAPASEGQEFEVRDELQVWIDRLKAMGVPLLYAERGMRDAGCRMQDAGCRMQMGHVCGREAHASECAIPWRSRWAKSRRSLWLQSPAEYGCSAADAWLVDSCSAATFAELVDRITLAYAIEPPTQN